ncbi:MAG: von Willebrand factor type A domain-containing protein [Gemmobacter sp.]
MTDDLDRLRAALKAPPPAPGSQARMAALEAAMKNFDDLHDAPQGIADAPRSTEASPKRSGLLSGVWSMLKPLARPGVLAASTSVVAALAAVVVFSPDWMPRVGAPPVAPQPVAAPEMPVAEPEAVVVAEPQAKVAPASEPPMMDMAAEEAAPLVASPPARSRAEAPAGAVAGFAADTAVAAAVPMEGDAMRAAPAATEAFANAEANPVKVTAQEPVSTFSIDVDTASWAVIRQSLNSGTLPPAEAVRIEEMVNYFPYAYPAPEGDAPFRADVSVFQTPWNADTRLVRIGLQGRLPAVTDRPALNLVFLIDTSGSMDEPAKLPLLKQALRLTLPQLRPEDQVAIVAYAGSAGVVLEPTAASDTGAVSAALDRLQAGGGTAGAEGLALAYEVAARMAGDGEVSRVLLATDGDFNLGISDPSELIDLIAKKRESGTYLSVLGFGRGNLDDATMQALAQNGNGLAAYIDTAQEARKVLVDQLSGALFPLADDVKVQVEWNPAQVAEYRLIGYETRALNREDFNNDRVDAGEIGAGHQVTALYEITAPDSPARLTDPLRYGAEPAPSDAAELGFLRLRYKAPGAADSTLIEAAIAAEDAPADADARFAAAIAGFGQVLAGSTYVQDWGWADAIALAEGARGDDPFGYRVEAVNLMRLAQSLSPR